MITQPTEQTPGPKPMSEKRLEALRSLKLAVLIPTSYTWTATKRAEAALLFGQFTPVITELIAEIDALDLALDASETELEQLKQADASAAVRAISLAQAGPGRFRVRWTTGTTRRSQTWQSRAEATQHVESLRAQAWSGGAR